MTPLEFRNHQKTRVHRLLCSIVCVMMYLAILIELWILMDRGPGASTDGEMDATCVKFGSRGEFSPHETDCNEVARRWNSRGLVIGTLPTMASRINIYSQLLNDINSNCWHQQFGHHVTRLRKTIVMWTITSSKYTNTNWPNRSYPKKSS